MFFFFHTNPYTSDVDVRQYLYFELGLPVVYQETWTIPRYSDFRLFNHVRGFVRLFGRYTCFGRFGHFACFGRFVSVVSFRCLRFSTRHEKQGP